MKRFLATMLLPLSLVPVALALPYVADQHDSFKARYVDREALAAPAVGHPDAGTVPAYRDAIPVLVYHGLNDLGARWSVTRETFARHMAALHDAGFHTVSSATYAKVVRGEEVELPSRPVLVTFDDGRLDSFRGADAVLDRYGFRATMFAIAGAAIDGSRTYLSPDELNGMQESGRWDIEFHAGEGHTEIETASGEERPFYAALEPDETVAEFGQRVEADLDAGIADLQEMVPSATLDDLFAVPYSDFGQAPGGDPRVAVASLRAMRARFDAVFVQRSEIDPAQRGQRGVLSRYEPTSKDTPKDLLRLLRRGTADKEA